MPLMNLTAKLLSVFISFFFFELLHDPFFFLPKTEYKHNTVYLSPLSTELISSSFRHFRFFLTALFFLFQIALGQRRGLSKIDGEEMSLRYECADL